MRVIMVFVGVLTREAQKNISSVVGGFLSVQRWVGKPKITKAGGVGKDKRASI